MGYTPSAKEVMELRQKTGVGMMDCKKALIASEGDEEKAIDFLREKGLASAQKKEGRVAAEGIVFAASKNGKSVLIEVNCETDFVAGGPLFKEYVAKVADYVLDNSSKTVEEITADCQPLTNDYIMKIGEKLSIRRFVVFEANDSVIDSYIHMGGTIGVLVEATSGAAQEVVHDVALQIAAANASYITKEEVPSAELDHEREILKAQALNEPNPKPMNIIEKMIDGRINKYYKDVCLYEQIFVKNSDMTISQYLKQNGDVKVIKFVRFAMGEGLQKKEDNMAGEIADTLAKAGL